MVDPVYIIGAGLTGLIAAQAWPQLTILEAAPQPTASHKALLRFRSDNVSQLTGIPFRAVTVRKGIFTRSGYVNPSIAAANRYSQKVLGRLLPDRSIWNIEPATRYIAPSNFYEQLVERSKQRIHWNTLYSFSSRFHVISTAPMPETLYACNVPPPDCGFQRAPIAVERITVPKADIFQTIYFPDDSTAIYRASMTGDLMIVESTSKEELDGRDYDILEKAFGFSLEDAEPLDRTQQEYGKIMPLPDPIRKGLLYALTTTRNVYSLGRFACWRNILLDDVVNDIAVLKRLLNSASTSYDAARLRAVP